MASKILLIEQINEYFKKQIDLATDEETKWLILRFNSDISDIIKNQKTEAEKLRHATPFGIKVGE